MSNQARVPVSVDELKENGVDVSNIPEGFSFAAIYSSPYDMARGLKRWIDDGCPDPFKFSSSYTKLFDECVQLKNEHEIVSKNLIGVCKELDALKTTNKNLENTIGENELAVTDANSEKAMNGYRIESLTKQVESANVEIASLKNGIQRHGEDVAVEKNETSRLNAQVEELDANLTQATNDLTQATNDWTSEIKDRERAEILVTSLKNRLEGSRRRRFICRLFGI